jgi:hypothetical protein
MGNYPYWSTLRLPDKFRIVGSELPILRFVCNSVAGYLEERVSERPRLDVSQMSLPVLGVHIRAISAFRNTQYSTGRVRQSTGIGVT